MAECGGLSAVRAAHPSPRLEPHAALSSSRSRCPSSGPCWVPIFLPRGVTWAGWRSLLWRPQPVQPTARPAPHLPVATSGLARCLPWADLPLGTPGASLGPHSLWNCWAVTEPGLQTHRSGSPAPRPCPPGTARGAGRPPFRWEVLPGSAQAWVSCPALGCRGLCTTLLPQLCLRGAEVVTVPHDHLVSCEHPRSRQSP